MRRAEVWKSLSPPRWAMSVEGQQRQSMGICMPVTWGGKFPFKPIQRFEISPNLFNMLPFCGLFMSTGGRGPDIPRVIHGMAVLDALTWAHGTQRTHMGNTLNLPGQHQTFLRGWEGSGQTTGITDRNSSKAKGLLFTRERRTESRVRSMGLNVAHLSQGPPRSSKLPVLR